MTNAWIDEDLYREPWVRSVGPTATHLYLAATTLLHREAREEHFLTRQELRDAYPWEITDTDLEAALQRLVARDRVVLNGDEIELPMYQFEQEDNAKRKDRKAQNKVIAAKAIKNRKRDDAGRLVANRPANVQRNAGRSSASLEVTLDDPASYPSSPIQSGPSFPPSAAPASPERGGPQARIFDHFSRRFSEKAGGAKPTQNAGDFAAIARLLKQHGFEEVVRRVDILFDSPPFRFQGSSPSIKKFIGGFDELATVQQPLAGGRPVEGVITGPNSFMRIGKSIGPNGEEIDKIEPIFPRRALSNGSGHDGVR